MTDVLVPLIVAVTEFAPAPVPRVRVFEAIPLEFVVEVADDTLPPPEATAQLSVAPVTVFP